MSTSDFARRQTARHYESFSLVVAASAQNSASAVIQGFTSFSLFVPTIDGSGITFLGSQSSGGTFYSLTKNGTAVTYTSAASHLTTGASALDAFAGLYAIKVSASNAQTSGSVTFVLGAKS
jgi:hypothetical protein